MRSLTYFWLIERFTLVFDEEIFDEEILDEMKWEIVGVFFR